MGGRGHCTTDCTRVYLRVELLVEVSSLLLSLNDIQNFPVHPHTTHNIHYITLHYYDTHYITLHYTTMIHITLLMHITVYNTLYGCTLHITDTHYTILIHIILY